MEPLRFSPALRVGVPLLLRRRGWRWVGDGGCVVALLAGMGFLVGRLDSGDACGTRFVRRRARAISA